MLVHEADTGFLSNVKDWFMKKIGRNTQVSNASPGPVNLYKSTSETHRTTAPTGTATPPTTATTARQINWDEHTEHILRSTNVSVIYQ